MKHLFFIATFFLFLSCFDIAAQCPSSVSSIRISTGFNHVTNSPFPVASPLVGDPYWVVVTDNQASTSEPRPAYVIPAVVPPSIWTYPTSTSNWISWYPINNGVNNGTSCTSPIPIVFERKFCINPGTNLDLISMNIDITADDCAQIFLNGVNIGSSILYGYGSFHNINIPAAHPNNFVIGQNTIQIKLVNAGGPPMGVILDGVISGPTGAFNKTECCSGNIFISGGKKYFDVNGNGMQNPLENGIPGWTINLKNSSNTIIASAITDPNGFYSFSNIPTSPTTANNTSLLTPGSTYYIEEVNPAPGIFVQTQPSAGGRYTIVPTSNQVINGLNFGNYRCPTAILEVYPNTFCENEPVFFSINGGFSDLSSYTFTWNFGDGTTGTGSNATHIFSNTGGASQNITVTGISSLGICPIVMSKTMLISTACCPNCLPSFRPIPNHKYILSAWVSEQTIQAQEETFVDPVIYLKFNTVPGGLVTFGPYTAKGNIIDEWQRIDQEFIVPANATDIKIELASRLGSSEPVYFDDVRIHPFDAGFKSYVYDPITLKFTAELDNNNYATLYEYDEEGKLVRVKKETERKKVTIKESRNSSVKKP